MMQFSNMHCYIHTNKSKLSKKKKKFKKKNVKRVGRRVPSSKLVWEVWWPAVNDPFFIREGGRSGGAGSGGGG